MNKNDFLNMIGDTVRVDRQMIGEIYELINIFPYFQSAHLLLLKGLQRNDDVKFENQLRGSSFYIADREVLYYLLNPPGRTNQLPAKLTTEAEPAVTYIPDQADVRTPSPEIVGSSDFIQNDLHAAVSPDDSVAVFDEQNELQPPDAQVDSYDVPVPGLNDSQESDDELLELEIPAGESDATDNNAIIINPGENDSKKLQAELIDKFIITNPRIEPNRGKMLLPIEDISKPSVEAEGGFITETLAKIYVNQGYYSKSIDIYEKLSLKFPEKSSYFATQIEKVKEYIKN